MTARVLAALRTGPRTMAELLAALGGDDPAHVRVALSRLVAAGRVVKRPAMWAVVDETPSEDD